MYGMIPGPPPKPTQHVLSEAGTSLWKTYENYQKEMIEEAQRDGVRIILSHSFEVLYEKAVRG